MTHTATNYRRVLKRHTGYRTCIIVAAIARAGGTMNERELRRLIGKYATNIIYGVRDVGLIRGADSLEAWHLTAAGRELAELLLGPLTLFDVQERREQAMPDYESKLERWLS